MVGHINSSLEGLTTIRASEAENNIKNEFDRHHDLYSSAVLTLRLAKIGFDFFIDSFSALLTIVIVARFVFFDHGEFL